MPNLPPLSNLNIQFYSPQTTTLKVFFHIFCKKHFYSETNVKHTIYALVNNSALNTGNLLRE